MDLQKTLKGLEYLSKAIGYFNEAGIEVEDLDETYDLINNELCEAIEQANEIKREQEKGADND